jgi:hypothetical protein
VWQEVLKGKYGVNSLGRVKVGLECQPWYSSLWWKDLCSIDTNLDTNWFAHSVFKKLGNGANTSFWNDIWVGEVPLKDRFSRLFTISTQKENTVASLWNPIVGEEHWRLLWRRRFFAWEEDMVEELKIYIGHILLTEEEDSWCWKHDLDAGFTVKSAYSLVSNLSGYVGPRFDSFGNLFDAIWKCPAPSKASGFIWQALHNRIPTKDNFFDSSNYSDR